MKLEFYHIVTAETRLIITWKQNRSRQRLTDQLSLNNYVVDKIWKVLIKQYPDWILISHKSRWLGVEMRGTCPILMDFQMFTVHSIASVICGISVLIQNVFGWVDLTKYLGMGSSSVKFVPWLLKWKQFLLTRLTCRQ